MGKESLRRTKVSPKTLYVVERERDSTLPYPYPLYAELVSIFRPYINQTGVRGRLLGIVAEIAIIFASLVFRPKRGPLRRYL